MDDLEIISSRKKQKSFKFGDYTVRSRYGTIKAGKCCGNRCRYCVYLFKWEKGCTDINRNMIKDIEDLF